MPDHSTLSRPAETLEVPHPQPRRDGEPMHLLADGTVLRLCGAGEGQVEKHGANTRRSPRRLHIGLDAGTGQIVAAALAAKAVDDEAEAGPMLDQVAEPVASFTADGTYDREGGAAALVRLAAVVEPWQLGQAAARSRP